MPLFEIVFKVRISGYGGPGSSWAKHTLTFEAKNKREANKFFSEELIDPPQPPNYFGWGILRRELGTWYRAVEVTTVNVEKYNAINICNVFEPRVYTQDELRKIHETNGRKKI